MKKTKQIIIFMLITFVLSLGCSKDDPIIPPLVGPGENPTKPQEPSNPGNRQFEMVDVKIIFPQGSEIELKTTTAFSLASSSSVAATSMGNLPFNKGTVQLAYLMDLDDNLLLAGFLTDERKEISAATTAEVMLYFGLGYQLLPEEIKKPYLRAVQQVAGFSDFVSNIETLFGNNPLMYTEGTYQSILNAKIDEISTKETIDLTARIEVDSGDTRSGITVSDVDAFNVQVQNSYPRRAHTFVYKKSSTDENGNVTQLPNYTAKAVSDFKLAPGGRNSGLQDGSASIQQQCTVAAKSNIENTTTSGSINLPLEEGELSAEYELVVVGPGTGASGNSRDFTPAERAKFEQLSKEAFILDNFLPTLLDIGGNKGLLPKVGSAKEGALVNAVMPYLEANPNVLAQVLENDFDAASKDFIPFLYEDIRQSNDLRELLKNVYDVVDGGEFPNTFIQSQELIETGEARLKALTSIIDRNINSYNNKCNNFRMKDTSNFESWTVKSSDGKVKVGPECLVILLDEVGDITVQVTADLENGQTLEYEWRTSGTFSGRIQDINGDPSNFGTSVTTANRTISFSSAALNSELSDGDNIENVTVTAYVKNANGTRDEVGSDEMKVNIKKRSFVISPDEVYIEGGRNVILRIRHNDGMTVIPSETTDYKLVWRTSGKYGQLSGRNMVETRYNDDSIFYQSQDKEVEMGVDEVSVDIYAKTKLGTGDYQLVDDAQAIVITKNNEECDFELYPLSKLFENPETANNCPPEAGGTAYMGNVIVYVPIDEDAKSYSVQWTDVYIGSNNSYFNLSGFSWTNENFDTVQVKRVGNMFQVYSGLGNGAACSNHPDIGKMKGYLNSVQGFATVTICY
ncbi:hypothetical protein H4O18_07080 [Arenibacter sp. BSSL-BM3]|uniref:Ig-like domain-containing protein n=1 Tax=Arenibacter arenosicollis TaxID=2762274 RepID=A0ABR7QKN5_9FLAO|nr:hypothetical protein [Arenibacter arenosicollis]MBC8767751.1 hypothetical protein [Arenibacter arenosicollis]